jgi:diguanylate cyclase (GGDEF)-like protein
MIDSGRLRIRDLVTLLRAEDYIAIGSGRRFRAVERRFMWQSTRAAMLVVVVGAPIHIAALSFFHPADAGFVALVIGALGAAALVGWWTLGRWFRHSPELVAFVISLAVAAVSMCLALAGPRLVALTIGYLLFLPTLVTLVLPWRSWTEVRWLAVYAISVILFLTVLVPAGPLAVDDRHDLIFGLLVVSASAFTGHTLLIRHRIRSFVQVQTLGRLQRRESRQRAELERVYRALEVTARTDQLTGVNNRVKLEEDLRVVRGRLARTGSSFGVLEVDLDRFKGVNDAFGHLAGDEVLRRVAKTLRAAVRRDDAVYRYGGEEFLIVLGVVPGGVREAAERVRLAVEDLGLVHPSNPPFGIVTISVGATEITSADATLTDAQWFARVDAALYQAKAEGRNRVAVAPSTKEPTGPTSSRGLAPVIGSSARRGPLALGRRTVRAQDHHR